MFTCTQCGACCYCESAWQLPEGFFDPDKKCCKYLIDNKCSIYDTRPDFCHFENWSNHTDENLQSYCDFMKSLRV